MKYRKLREIPMISDFEPQTGIYGYEKEGKEFLLMDGVSLECPGSLSWLSLRNGYLYVRYSSGRFEMYHNGILVKSIDERVFPCNEQTMYVMHYFRDKNFESYQNILDPFTRDLLLEKYIPYDFHIEGDVLIAYCNDKGEIKRINTDTEDIWVLKLSSLGDVPYAPEEHDRIDRILGIAHGNLWFYTKSERLVALDIQTGKFVKGFSCHDEDLARGYEVNEGLGVPYLGADLDIYGVGYVFTRIDTKTGMIVERYWTTKADPEGLGSYYGFCPPLLQGDYFTFVGRKPREGSEYRWVGIFDYRARRLVWEYEVISQEEWRKKGNYLILPEPLYMGGDRLYIKDFHRNLHIFEREE